MNVMLLITHLSTIMGFVQACEKFIGVAVAEKAIPKASEAKELLDQTRALLASGIINIPGVSAQQIADALKMVEDQICPPSSP